MLNLTIPLQDDSLSSNLVTVRKLELVFSLATHRYIYIYISICSTPSGIYSTGKCTIENTILIALTPPPHPLALLRFSISSRLHKWFHHMTLWPAQYPNATSRIVFHSSLPMGDVFLVSACFSPPPSLVKLPTAHRGDTNNIPCCVKSTHGNEFDLYADCCFLLMGLAALPMNRRAAQRSSVTFHMLRLWKK